MINYNELFEKSKELAKESWLTQLELYQRFMFERILERISVSKYNENFILKGGLFSEFKNGFNSGRAKSHAEAETRRNRKIIKLIEPNYGRIVTLQVMEEEPVLSMMIDMLTTINGYQNTSVTTSGNVVTFTFEDGTLAEAFRSTWRD